MNKNLIPIILICILMAACNSSKVTISERNAMIKPDTTNYSTYWTAMRCAKPELISKYNVEKEKIEFADGLTKIKEGKVEKAESIFKNLFKESKNDTIVDNSRRILEQLLAYQSKWQDYLDIFRIKSQPDSIEKRRLLFPTFIGINSSIEFSIDFDTIPIKLKHGCIFVPVKINDYEFEFLFDTGAQRTILSDEVANESKVHILNTHSSALVGSTGKSSDMMTGAIKELSLAKVKFVNHPCIITDNSNMKFKFLFYTFISFDGIIGWDIIKNLDVEIDYKNEKMIIRKPIEKNDKVKNLFWLNEPIVKLKSITGTDLHFFFDLGAQNSSFYDLLLLKLNPDDVQSDNKTIYGIGGSVNMDIKTIPNITFIFSENELNFENFNQTYENKNFFKLDGVLGNDIGQDCTLRIDATNGIIELSKKK